MDRSTVYQIAICIIVMMVGLGCSRATSSVTHRAIEFAAVEHSVRSPDSVDSHDKEATTGVSSKSLFYPELVIPDDQRTEKFVRQFSSDYRGFILAGLARKQHYEGTIHAVFSRYGLPQDLQNIAFVESQFLPQAKNKSGAAGLWQFMPSTAKAYGLTVDKKHDERLDVLHSTIAVAEYLKSLYDHYEDWNLVLAAYHAGKGTIDSLQLKYGGGSPDTYGQLADAGRIPESTQDFVARVLAITKICNNLSDYGFTELARNGDY